TGDHILERLTPNPQAYIPPYHGKDTGLGDYMASLGKLEKLPRDVLVCPGHGATFRDLHARMDAIRQHHVTRATQIADVLGRRDGQTIVDLALQLWDGLKPGPLALAAREVHGHLDMLSLEGRCAREERDGVWHYRRTA